MECRNRRKEEKPTRSAILLVLAGLMGGRLTAQANTRWECGTLTLISAGTVVPVWSTGDTTAVLEWPREKDVVGTDTKPRTIAQASSQICLLNALGEQGWELVTRESGGRLTATYTFKRRKT